MEKPFHFNKRHGKKGQGKSISSPQSQPGALPRDFVQKKSLGQHFLSDQSILSFEAERLSCEGQGVLEIGAGDGRLSEKILAQNPSSLTLVELDLGLAKFLRNRFRKEKRVVVAEADILGYLGSTPLLPPVITGNIPYKISGPLFALLSKSDFTRALFCVQAEMAQRLCAKPGTHDWGKLSVFLQHKYEVKTLLKVPPGAFSPPPKVESAIIELLQKKKMEILPLPENFEQVVSALFSHRLQSVGNALFHSRHIFCLGKEDAKQLANTIIYSKRKVFMLQETELAEIAQAVLGRKS